MRRAQKCSMLSSRCGSWDLHTICVVGCTPVNPASMWEKHFGRGFPVVFRRFRADLLKSSGGISVVSWKIVVVVLVMLVLLLYLYCLGTFGYSKKSKSRSK